MKPTLTLAFVLLTGALNGQECSIVAQDAVIEKIETGYAFTEGPAVAKDGSVYLTDAYYHRGYWPEGQHEIQEVRGVYHLNPEGKVTRVIGDYKQPNGIIGTPDGKTLYVADIGDRKIWRYDILFITARTSVYSLKMHVKGVQ